jgi:hypothetical protein
VDGAAAGAVVSLGREWPTPAGPIDNVLLTAGGIVVLVETKLHRNPEARRKVISQILDYAVHASRWKFADIEARALDRFKKSKQPMTSLYEALGVDDEASFHDDLVSNLEAGRMLLLVVGDGIREGTHELASMVATRPDKLFRLALIDLGVFSLSKDELVVAPRVAVQTREIERAVVTIRYENEKPRVEVQSQAATERPLTISSEQLLAKLRARNPAEAVNAEKLIKQFADAGFQVDWKTAGATIKTLDPVSGAQPLSLLVINTNGQAWVYGGWLEGQLKRVLSNPDLASTIQKRWLKRLVDATGATNKNGGASAPLADIGPNIEALVRSAIEFREELQRECQP